MDEAFSGLTGYRRVVDDIVIYDSDSTQHAEHVRQFLLRCAERRITLNQDKWEYTQPRVTFAGFNLSKDGYSIDSAITDAIAKFPTPSNRTDLLPSSDWLTNWQLALTHSRDYLNHYDRCSAPKMSLYGHQITSKHSRRQIKTYLTLAPTLQFFDPQKPMRLCTDASRQGIDFVLQQTHGYSYKPDRDSSLMPSPDMQSSNWSYSE